MVINLRYLNQFLWKDKFKYEDLRVAMLYSDASDTGYGGYTVEHGYHMAQGLWTQDEATRSSTWRELRAVRMVLESLMEILKNNVYVGSLITRTW